MKTVGVDTMTFRHLILDLTTRSTPPTQPARSTFHAAPDLPSMYSRTNPSRVHTRPRPAKALPIAWFMCRNGAVRMRSLSSARMRRDSSRSCSGEGW